MKKLLIIPLFFLCGQLLSQIYLPTNPTIYGVKENRSKTLYALHPPEKSDLETNTNDTSAQIFYYKTDSTFWGWSQARGFFRIGTTFTGGGGGDVDLSTLYAHSNSNFDNTKILFYNIDNELIDSFNLQYTTLYVSSDFLLTDTLDLPNTKLLSLNDSAKASWGGGTLQDVFNKETGEALLTIDDTINIDDHRLLITGNGLGLFQTYIQNGDLASGIAQNSNSISLSTQDNTGLTKIASISVGTDSIRLTTGNFDATQLNLELHHDSLEIHTPTFSILKTKTDDGAIYLGKYGDGIHTGTAVYNLGVDANHKIVEIDAGAVTRVYNEIITGTTDPTFHVAHDIAVFGETVVHKNGVRLEYFTDYTEDGGDVVLMFVPVEATDVFVIDYTY